MRIVLYRLMANAEADDRVGRFRRRRGVETSAGGRAADVAAGRATGRQPWQARL